MKIYIDLILIQDTIIMSLLLFLVSKLLNIKLKINRIIFMSFISSILSIGILVIMPNLYDNLFVKLFFSFILLKFCLKLKIDNEFISKIILFWIVANLFGGITFASNENLFLTIIALIITIIYVLKFKNSNTQQLLLDVATCFIEFEYNKTIYKFKALVDTGHAVKTMYNEDVIFAKKDLFYIEGSDDRSRRIVRYKTVSGNTASTGIKVYNIKITYGGKNICSNAVIVSTPNISNQFDAIVGLSLIEGGCLNGNSNFDETKSKKIIS